MFCNNYYIYILCRYTAAVKENDFVYHLSVPALSALEEIKGVNFVKPLPFQHDDASVAGTDIFKKLVPMKAHESSSLYRFVDIMLNVKVLGTHVNLFLFHS